MLINLQVNVKHCFSFTYKSAMAIRVYLYKRSTISLPSAVTSEHKDNIFYDKLRDISTH
jgi:hypothetical protein